MSDKKSIQSKNPSAKISVKDMDFQTSIRNFFEAMGEDPDRKGIKDTPQRVEKTFEVSWVKPNKGMKTLIGFSENVVLSG